MRRPAIYASVWVLALAAHAGIYKSAPDFHVFYTAAVRVLAKEPIYRLSDGATPFKYSPLAAYLLAPLGLLPERAAHAVWLFFSALALLVFFFWAATELTPGDSGGKGLAALLLVSPHLHHLFSLGQADALLLGGSAASERSARSRPAFAGVLWALACLFKAPYLVLVWPMVLFGQWRRLGAGLVAIAMGLFLPAGWLGPAGAMAQLEAWRTLQGRTAPEMLCHAHNQSLFALACGFFDGPISPGYRAAVFGGAALLVLLGTWAVMRFRRHDCAEAQRLCVALALAFTALLSPLGWRTNLVALLPLLLWLLELRGRLGSPALRFVVLALLAIAAVPVGVNYEVWGPVRFRQLLAWRVPGWAAVVVALGGAALAASAARLPIRRGFASPNGRPNEGPQG